jgi:hypothetical protein
MSRLKTLPWCVLTALVVPVLLYVPFRFLAGQTNSTLCRTIEGPSPSDDGFAYPIAIGVWPAYMFIGGLAVQLVLNWRRSQGGGTVAAVLAIITSYSLPSLLDRAIGIRDCGGMGFVSVPINNFGFATTPLISMIACPVLFVVGSLLGCRLRNRGRIP